MRKILFILSMPLLLLACEQAEQVGDKAAREITGSNMIKQKKQLQQQLNGISEQQQARFKEMEQQ